MYRPASMLRHRYAWHPFHLVLRQGRGPGVSMLWLRRRRPHQARGLSYADPAAALNPRQSVR